VSDDLGFTVWITGLSGSGKHALAVELDAELRRRRRRVELLVGKEFRQSLSQGLGFSRADRLANVRRIGYVAALLTRNGVAVVTTSVSPHRAARDECRAMIGRFVEVYVDCPVEVCARRERDGLYERAARGELDDVAGVDDPYEPPLRPEVVCRSADEEPAACAARVVAALEALGYLDAAPADAREAEQVKTQLRALGYG
jgi:adenylylsulfate kinase